MDRKHYLKIYQVKWLKERRAKWIAQNGPCKQCGSSDRLEIDHIDPLLKKEQISKLWSATEERRKEELAKCQVLCYSCHKEKTREHALVKKHGITMYERHKCRCDVCKAAKSFKNSKRKRLTNA